MQAVFQRVIEWPLSEKEKLYKAKINVFSKSAERVHLFPHN